MLLGSAGRPAATGRLFDFDNSSRIVEVLRRI